jgi:hypothetical protein
VTRLFFWTETTVGRPPTLHTGAFFHPAMLRTVTFASSTPPLRTGRRWALGFDEQIFGTTEQNPRQAQTDLRNVGPRELLGEKKNKHTSPQPPRVKADKALAGNAHPGWGLLLLFNAAA